MTVRGSAWILAVAGLAGACSMILELSAVRLIAPWFGTSSAVWTHVIGVVLLALSTGYLVGARLSRGKSPMRSLGLCLLAAAAATGWVPAVTAPVASWFRPGEVALDEAAELLRWGSLAAALVLFLPPTLVLGCIPPLVTEIVQRGEGCSAGDAGGRVLAFSTAGSIVGTFATTYVALPRLGLSLTFLAASGLLALLGALVLWRSPRSGAGGTVLLTVAVVAALGVSRVRAPTASPGWRLTDSIESAYQSLRVVEGEDGGHPMRRLQVNEAFDSFQSVWQPAPGFLPEGYYYNLFALPPNWARRPGEWRLSVLGLGAGTAWRVVAGELPPGMTLRASGAEIDPAVVDLGVRWFDLPVGDPSRRVLGGFDARVALRHLEPDLDQIVLDAYANQMEIPAHLCTREFFREVRAHLGPRRWLCVNVGGFGLADPVVEAVAATAGDAFGRRVLAVRVPFSRNCVLFARKDADPPTPDGSEWYTGTEALDRRLSALSIRGAWRWFEPGSTPILTDDCNPIDRLQRQSVEEGKQLWLGSR
jgi:spermidine synthase